MTTMDTDCSSCGCSDWKKLAEDDYPERRRERDRTVKTVYICTQCGAEGKHFDDGESGYERFTGAMR